METSIIDYTCNVEELKGVSRDRVSATLAEVGFSEEGQAAPITSLSGGWKMKLALARAMLQEAQVACRGHFFFFVLRAVGIHASYFWGV